MTGGEFPDALPLGTLVGGYQVARVIGQGGFGITYEGVSPAGVTTRRVAIKEFFPRGHAYRLGTEIRLTHSIDQSTWLSVQRRFEAEAKKLVDLYDHPAIVKGENFVREHGSSFLLMEYVEGPSLAQWLQGLETPPGEALIRRVMDPVLDAVAYLHARGEMHRDISPHNILVRTERRGRTVLEPVLIDFGAAGAGLDRERVSSVVVANLTYAPLEQLRPNVGTQGTYTDIYALGGVLYYCVAGGAPVPAEERAAAITFGQDNEAGFLPATAFAGKTDFSPAFLSAVDRALSMRPADRPQTIAAFRAALGWSGAGEGPVVEAPEPTPQDPQKGPADPERVVGAAAEPHPDACAPSGPGLDDRSPAPKANGPAPFEAPGRRDDAPAAHGAAPASLSEKAASTPVTRRAERRGRAPQPHAETSNPAPQPHAEMADPAPPKRRSLLDAALVGGGLALLILAVGGGAIVYHMTADTPGIVTHSEPPMIVAQPATALPPAPAAEDSQQKPPDSGAGSSGASRDAPAAQGDLQPSEAATTADAGDGSKPIDPRRVRFVTVRPDGSVVEGAAPSAAAPEASPVANPPVSPNGAFVVQVASQRSEAEALGSWKALQARYPSLLSGYEASVKRADLGDRGVYYRAQVGPFAAVDQAYKLCYALRAQGDACIVNQITPAVAQSAASADPNPATPSGASQGKTDRLATAPAPASTASQRAVFLQEKPGGQPLSFEGTVSWTTETVGAVPGRPAVIGIRGEVSIPAQKISMVFLLRRNTDPTLPASHTIDLSFTLPKDFAFGDVDKVPAVATKPSADARGSALAGLSVKVQSNVFLVGLSQKPEDLKRNLEQLQGAPWLDVPIVFSDGKRALLAFAKGPEGERVFREAFAAWGQTVRLREEGGSDLTPGCPRVLVPPIAGCIAQDIRPGAIPLTLHSHATCHISG